MEMKQVDDLKLIKLLGKGAFGEVYLTQKNGMPGYYATKSLDRAYSEKKENLNRLINEITVFKKIQHPNVVSLVDLKQTKSHIYIVMEYCNGGSLTECLHKYMKQYGRPFPEQVVQYIMKQIISGLDAFHSRNILHRDLKLDNILICFNSEEDKNTLNMLKATVKLTDFGFSKILKQDLASTIIGTPVYMPPDMLEAMKNQTKIQSYATKADIWSLGVLCYEMLMGVIPFNGQSMADLFSKVKKGIYALPMTLSQEAAFFIVSMLQENQEKRPSCKELLNHEFITKNTIQFHKMNIRVIPGVVGQKGNLLYITTGMFIQNKNQPESKVIPQPIPKQESKPQININSNQNIYQSPNPVPNPIQNQNPNPNQNKIQIPQAQIKMENTSKPQPQLQPQLQPQPQQPKVNPYERKNTNPVYQNNPRIVPINQKIYKSAMPTFHGHK